MKDEEKETKKGEALPEEDDVVKFEFNEDGEEDLKKTLKKFRADLKVCKKENSELNATNIEYLTGWQKERADFLNYKKQEDIRRDSLSEAVRERVIMRFLTILDSFNMAFANKEAWEKVDVNWRKGVEYIYSQMNGIFEEFGVKPVGEVGEAFDPSIHQSVEMIHTDKKENDHKIANIVQKGYKLGEHTIRPARVNIWEYKE